MLEEHKKIHSDKNGRFKYIIISWDDYTVKSNILTIELKNKDRKSMDRIL